MILGEPEGCGFSWQDVGQESSPNGLVFQSNQDDSKSNSTSTTFKSMRLGFQWHTPFNQGHYMDYDASQPSLQHVWSPIRV